MENPSQIVKRLFKSQVEVKPKIIATEITIQIKPIFVSLFSNTGKQLTEQVEVTFGLIATGLTNIEKIQFDPLTQSGKLYFFQLSQNNTLWHWGVLLTPMVGNIGDEISCDPGTFNLNLDLRRYHGNPCFRSINPTPRLGSYV